MRVIISVKLYVFFLYVVSIVFLPFTVNAQNDSIQKKHPKINLKYDYYYYKKQEIQIKDSSLNGFYFGDDSCNACLYYLANRDTKMRNYMKDNKSAYNCIRQSTRITGIMLLPDMACVLSGAAFLGLLYFDGQTLSNAVLINESVTIITGIVFAGTLGLHIFLERKRIKLFLKGIRIYNHDNGYN
ncbi:MAG TPA: hypothetical protein VK806_12865 [Bacteroidia bacterium]|jgi:hypothetical protein|nr:hypothetical protein [Bacteroidia bacterium]